MNKIQQFVRLGDRSKGILMALLGVVVLSPDSLLIRLAGLDDYTLLFYRGLLPACAISLILWLYYRADFIPALMRIGWAGVVNAVLFALVNITFISAIQRTSVANTLLFLSSAPIFAALLSLVVLRESQRLSTWIIRVTMNCCLSHLRKQRIRRHASLDDEAGPGERPDSGEPSPVERVQLSEMRAMLLRAMQRLDPALRAVLVLRDLQELDYQQIATVLGTPVGTVKSRLFRARTALRRAAEEEARTGDLREEPQSR